MDITDHVASLFEDGGSIEQSLPGYKKRTSQIRLARFVTENIYRAKNAVAEGPPGCHDPDQGVLMFDGTIKKISDVEKGDFLMGPDSKPREVLRLYGGTDTMCDVVPVKGDPWRVNIDHVLSLMKTGTGTQPTIDVTVREWLHWSAYKKHTWKLFRIGADFPTWRNFGGGKELPLDPYFLGVLLGDGGMTGASLCITKGDPEIRGCLEEQAKLFGLTVRTPDNRKNQHYLSGGVRSGSAPNPIIRILRTMNLWGSGAGDKKVPFPYKVASREQRAEVLAGLLDTDGHYGNGMYDYVSKSNKLAYDVAFIARSLGLAAYVKPCEKGCQTGYRGKYFRVSISGPVEKIPCRIPRKMATERKQIKNVLKTGFDIELVDTGQFCGVMVTGDGRYLLDDFTVTHNSGKSYAYSVPIVEMMKNGMLRRAVIATANIALQEQLVEKDLPTVKRILGAESISCSLLKGKNNYICNLKYRDFSANENILKEFRKELEEVVKPWLGEGERESGTKHADKSELGVELKCWPRISTTHEECLGSKCPFRKDKNCYAAKAAIEARSAQIIVTNFHVLLLGYSSLPDFDTLICDEGHALADIARDVLGFKLTPGGIHWVSNALKNHDRKAAQQMAKVEEAFYEKLEDYVGKDKWFRRVLLTHLPPSPDELLEGTGLLAHHLNMEVNSILVKMRTASEGRQKDLELELAKTEKDLARVQGVETRLRSYSKPSRESVVWISKEKIGKHLRYVIKSKPIRVAPQLKNLLFSNKEKSSVVLSATMTTDQGFDFVVEEIGMGEHEELVVPSPFKLASQAVLTVPVTLPAVPAFNASQEAKEAYYDAISDHLLELISMCRRTLCLFTSWNVLGKMNERLQAHRHTIPKVYVQGEVPKAKLIEAFRSVEEGVLLATKSFWEGVDIPGMQGIFIDKIPFPVPSDPLYAAMEENLKREGRNAFMDISIPKAILELRQGTGRLIRTDQDRGVIMLGDRRVHDKKYGDVLINALPPFYKARTLESAKAAAGRLWDENEEDHI